MFPVNGRINVEIRISDSTNSEQISVKAYKGIIGKIMEKIGFAILVDVNKEGIEVFVNKRSLAKQILIKQGLEQEKITNKIKDKVFEVVLNHTLSSETIKKSPLIIKKAIKSLAELEIHRNQIDENFYQTKLKEAQLNDVLSEVDLDLIWNNKTKLSSTTPAETENSKNVVYRYINGITDAHGKVHDIAVSSKNRLEYIGGLRSLVEGNSPIKVSLQTVGPEKNISDNRKEQSTMIIPLDDYLTRPESRSKFEKLPKQHQEYILNAATENYANISKEKQEELMKQEHDLQKVLKGEDLSQFKQCMKHANAQNAARNGFIHFRLQDASKTTSFERIYIQMNKERAEDLVHLLISELYKKGQYPGILDIKVAGPQVAGRTDGIVIYIGGTVKKGENDAPMRQKAIKERDRVLKKLEEIQEKNPELFGNGAMPFKEIYAPGIAIIPGLSTSESFTESLSLAIVRALANSPNRESFRGKIIESFFAPL